MILNNTDKDGLALPNQELFEDRVNMLADLSDLDFDLIMCFLRNANSDLIKFVDKIPFEQLCRKMQIIQDVNEAVKPLNIGLMMFNNNPEKFIPGARIKIVDCHEVVGDGFTEEIFEGPIPIQLKNAWGHIQTLFTREEVRKRDRRPADRFYNFPEIALKEALVNAVYHKDYSQNKPIEVSVKPDRIQILSFPGLITPVKIGDLKKGLVQIRTYRNKRLGDFLKGLHLIEGCCTGIPKIVRAMKKNGSPQPVFKTDKKCSYFLTILPVHPEAHQLTRQNARKSSL